MTGSPVFTFVQPADDVERWDAYGDTHPKGSVFHRAAMFRAYAKTAQYEPWALAACDESGRIVAMVQAVRVSTIAGLGSSLASRSILYAEPLCDDSDEGCAALEQLMLQHDKAMASRVLFTEVRPLFESGAERVSLEASGYEYLGYYNYVNNVAVGPDKSWAGVGKSTRKKITRSLKKGVEVTVDSSHSGIELMYSMVRTSYQRSNVPLVDKQLFHAVLDELPAESVQVRLAHFEGNLVAAGISLIDRGVYYAWYGGSERLNNVVPFACLVWNEIKWASENGLKLYDFGGAGWPEEEYGPREFKAKFGGDLVNFGRYRRVYSPLKMKLATTAYNTLRRVRSFGSAGSAPKTKVQK